MSSQNTAQILGKLEQDGQSAQEKVMVDPVIAEQLSQSIGLWNTMMSQI